MKNRLIALGLLAALLPITTLAAEIFPRGASWRIFKGYTEATTPDATAWRAIGFDDSTWTEAVTPVFYGESLTGTSVDDMRNNYTCVFIRRTFVVDNPAEVSELQLGAVSDDGFICWINNQKEVVRYNMPDGDIPADGLSNPALPEPIPFETHLLSNPRDYLVRGTNIIAIQAFNSSLGSSSDFVIDASLSGTVDETPPAMAATIPPDRALVRQLNTVEIHFNEPVAGVEAADLLINGQPATNVTVFDPQVYVFEFPQPTTGRVTVAWSPNHGIHDLAATPHDFAGGSWYYDLNPQAPMANLIISEFMANNDQTLHDEDGDHPDWIEIYNADQSTVDLGGWCLTDQTNNLTRWLFPRVSLPANSYLVVFASEKNRTNVLARLHTNFKLAKDGGYLALVDPLTNVVSEFTAYPPQFKEVSYGRERSNPNLVGYFLAPTPGMPNSTGGPGFSPEVQFSRVGSTFYNAFSLELSTASTHAIIRYTLNGTGPTNTSPIYTNPIPITTTTQVRAQAYAPGLLPGPMHSEAYLQLNSSVVNFSSDLPLIVLHNFSAGSVPASVLQFAQMELFEPKAGKSSLTNAPDLSTRMGFKLRGSSTQGYAKGSFAVEIWDEYNDDKNVSLLGMPADSDWVLYAPNNFEPVLIHNPFIHELSRQIGRYSPRTRFVEVYLNTAGGAISSANYHGIYVLLEKIKPGPKRVDIDKLEPEHIAPPQVTGGYLLKVDRPDPGDSGFYAGGLSILYVDPKERDMKLPQRDPQEKYIANYLNTFYTALNGLNATNPVNGYAQYVDVDSWIDHHLLNVVAFNVDALRLSAFFYKPRNGKLTMGPLWDFDRAMGSTDGRDANPRVWRSPSGDMGTDWFNAASTFSNPWYSKMFRGPDFWQKWIDQYQALRQGRFALTNINALIDSLANQVRQAQPREQARWGITPRGGSYQAEVNLMKTWFANRLSFMDTQFVNAPHLAQNGGPISPGFSLTISGAPSASIYYTLDGTDPRSSGGGLSPQTRFYEGPIVLTENARVVARDRDLTHYNLTGPNNPPLSSPWSAPVAATFVVQTPSLVITEIMYHPTGTSAGTNDTEDFEYVELKNIGANALDLTGLRLSGGIQFDFAGGSIPRLVPGQYVLVVKNRAAFLSRYPTATNLAGEYVGSLDNAGDQLVLTGALQEPILDFHYDPAWYPMTDGLGFSLVIANENAPLTAWTNQVNWRISSTCLGSPGQPDPPAPVLPPVRINEALTRPELAQLDSIELYNPTGTAADIGGWFLSDDFNRPCKFRIPDHTLISGGGFLVFSEQDFNSGAPDSFALSSGGDQVYLFSGDAATNLTGYAHGFAFGAAEPGVSFGRYLDSLDREHFVAQLRLTLNATNAGPRIGPVVINEIMYQPPPSGTNNNTRDEYLELHNLTAEPVPLFDPSLPTNTWHIQGGVDFHFPTNLTLPPHDYLLVVGFNPRDDAAALASFRALYQLDTNLLIVGPYEGSLNNAGERLRLFKPDSSAASASPAPDPVPEILVDEVNYSKSSPWPAEADGTGSSLQRLVSRCFGDDPLNWQAAAATPGRANAAASPLDTDGDGLPNVWELTHGLHPNRASGEDGAAGDPDGDGMTNLQEFLSGTDPRDGASVLKVSGISRADEAVTLRFHALAGKPYSLLYQEPIHTGFWRLLQEVPAQLVDTNLEVTDPGAGISGARFYRLRQP